MTPSPNPTDPQADSKDVEGEIDRLLARIKRRLNIYKDTDPESKKIHEAKIMQEARAGILQLLQDAQGSAKNEVLDELLEWQRMWDSLHKEPFNWYGSVKALKVSKGLHKPFKLKHPKDDKQDGGDNGA